MKRLLLTLLLFAGGAHAAIALDATFPKTAQQDGTTSNPLSLAATFNVSANRIVVVTVAADLATTTNFPATVAWTGGTPAGATAFTRNANGSGSFPGIEGVIAEVWTSSVTGALAGVNVSATLPTTPDGGAKTIGVFSFSGASTTIGNTGTNTVNGVANLDVTVTASGAGSVIVGCWGDDDSTTVGTALGNTTQTSIVNATDGSWHAVGYLTTPTSGAGSVTIGTSSSHTLRFAAAIELVLAAAAPACVPTLTLLGVTTC